MVLHRFYQLEPSSISDQSDLLRRALCDRDPSVMGATLNILLAQMKLDPLPFKDLVPSFISILKQIIGGVLAHFFSRVTPPEQPRHSVWFDVSQSIVCLVILTITAFPRHGFK
jgi:hypothetical protein